MAFLTEFHLIKKKPFLIIFNFLVRHWLHILNVPEYHVSTNKSEGHDITDILLKVALNTNIPETENVTQLPFMV